MRILHIETGRHLYGGALQVAFLLEGLQKAGVENHLACPGGSAIAEAGTEWAEVHTFPMAGDLDLRQLWQLKSLIHRIQPDLVHVHSRRGADIWGGLAARWAGVPAIVTRRVDNPEPKWWVSIKYRLYRQVITISEGIRRVLLEEGVPENKVHCVRSAVDLARYDQPADPTWFQKAFDVPEGTLTIGVIAQLIPRKGHRFLLAEALEIRKLFPSCHFLFFGKGPLEEELKDKCHELGLSEVVHFCGFRDDLPRVLPNLDVVVHPALMEGLGVSLLQACCAGVPIVAFASGGIPEVVQNEDNGFLLETGDALGLRMAILRLLGDKALRLQFGNRGRELAHREFGIDAMVQGNLTVYDRVRPSVFPQNRNEGRR